MTYQTIDIHENNAVAYLTLNRPEKLNSFNTLMSQEIFEILSAWSKDTHIRAVVINAKGRAFCAGQEISSDLLKANSDERNLGKVLQENYEPILKLITEMPKPVICAVQGIAAGAGSSLALICDIVFAAKSATFTQIFSHIALIPDFGATWFLPKMIGHAKAMGLFLTADKISATEAERLGMIWKVVEDETLQQDVIHFAENLATQATLSFALIKKAMYLSHKNDLVSQLAVERDLQNKAGHSEDFTAVATAFFAKQKVQFKGR